MTNKLYCPKCKGEVKELDEYPFLSPIFKCYHCDHPVKAENAKYYNDQIRGRPYFEWDCLTEEQLKIRPKLYCGPDKDFCGCKGGKTLMLGCECGKYLVKDFYPPEGKKIPSFCFNESANDTNVAIKQTEIDDVDDKNVVEWINFSDRKPEVGQKIIVESPKFGGGRPSYETYTVDHGHLHPMTLSMFEKGGYRWKPAQADKDIAQPIKQRIKDAIPLIRAQNEILDKNIDNILKASNSLKDMALALNDIPPPSIKFCKCGKNKIRNGLNSFDHSCLNCFKEIKEEDSAQPHVQETENNTHEDKDTSTKPKECEPKCDEYGLSFSVPVYAGLASSADIPKEKPQSQLALEKVIEGVKYTLGICKHDLKIEESDVYFALNIFLNGLKELNK